MIILFQIYFGWYTLIFYIKYGELPPTIKKSNRCSIITCMNLENCLNKNPLYYIYDEDETYFEIEKKIYKLQQSNTYKTILKEFKNNNITTINVTEACFFINLYDMSLCEYNKCNTKEKFSNYLRKRLKYWNEGKNHLLFDISDNDFTTYEREKAIIIKSGFSRVFYEQFFDISIPLLSKINFNNSNIKNISERGILFGFKGKYRKEKKEDKIRLKLYKFFHNRNDSIVIIHTDKNYNKYDYKKLLENIIFSLIPRGFGLHSYRLVESMAAGTIPIIISDNFVLPFEEIINWNEFSIRVMESQINKIPLIIQKYSKKDLNLMQIKSLQIYNMYFISWKSIIKYVIEILKKRLVFV